MRAWLWVLVLVAACGSEEPAANPDAAVDFSTQDRTITPSGPTGCRGYVQCLSDCGEDTTCSAMCMKNVTAAGKNLFTQALRCGQDWCLGTLKDMGPGDCVLDSSGKMLVDPPGGQDCAACLSNAVAQLFGDACMPDGDPNCNPIACQSLYTACGNSLP